MSRGTFPCWAVRSQPCCCPATSVHPCLPCRSGDLAFQRMWHRKEPPPHTDTNTTNIDKSLPDRVFDNKGPPMNTVNINYLVSKAAHSQSLTTVALVNLKFLQAWRNSEMDQKKKKKVFSYIVYTEEGEKWKTNCTGERLSEMWEIGLYEKTAKEKKGASDVCEVMHWGDDDLVRGQQRWEQIPWRPLLCLCLFVY